MKKHLLAMLCTAALALSASVSRAADTILMEVIGAKSGPIKGGVATQGKQGMLEVIAVSHEIVSPRDPASGLPTGRRMHAPLRIIKPVDKATPLLYQALLTNEVLSKVSLRFYGAQKNALGAMGGEMQYYTITLTNASIASIKMLPPSEGQPMETMEIALTYQKITWTWTDGGITASDDWVTAN